MRNGVSIYKGRYRADIKIGDTSTFLGVFDTREAAEQAYIDRQAQLHRERNNHFQTK